MSRLLKNITGLVVLVGIIVLYNFSFWLFEGNPIIPSIENTWWGGYYETQTSGKQWCVAQFFKNESGEIQMALISSFGQPDIFEVERTSTDRTFVHLYFTTTDDMKIKATQLYLGKRYILQRLMVGRFADFWKENTDISIRGNLTSSSPPNEFGIEPLSENDLNSFWKAYVRPGESDITPQQLLNKINVGF